MARVAALSPVKETTVAAVSAVVEIGGAVPRRADLTLVARPTVHALTRSVEAGAMTSAIECWSTDIHHDGAILSAKANVAGADAIKARAMSGAVVGAIQDRGIARRAAKAVKACALVRAFAKTVSRACVDICTLLGDHKSDKRNK